MGGGSCKIWEQHKQHTTAKHAASAYTLLSTATYTVQATTCTYKQQQAPTSNNIPTATECQNVNNVFFLVEEKLKWMFKLYDKVRLKHQIRAGHSRQLLRQRDTLLQPTKCRSLHALLLRVDTEGLAFFVFFLVSELLTNCHVVKVTMQKIFRVPSSA